MPQVYFLSIIANAVAGLTLAGDYLGERMRFLASVKNLSARKGIQVGVGLAAGVVGLLKFVFRSPGESLAVVGDALPALTGLALGLLLLAEAFRAGTAGGAQPAEQGVRKLADSALAYRVPAGIGGVLVAVAHFLFPAVPVL